MPVTACSRAARIRVQTYRSMVLLQHLHVRVVGQAFLADGREVGRLPSAAVQILLDLGRHVGGEMACFAVENVYAASQQSKLGVRSVSGVSEYVVVGAQRDGGDDGERLSVR
jgi:hypothetical protein